MSPPIHKDWWLAAALTSAALPPALAHSADKVDRPQSGVVTSVTQGATRGPTTTPLYIENARDRRLVTGPKETVHVLFSDQSALTVGPNSDVTIAKYSYDTQTKDGNILFEAAKGVFRVVGGLLSKKRETVLRTTTATIGIRGGITVVEHNDGQTRAVFLFGQEMRMTSPDGNQSQSVTRPGFAVTADGGNVSSPVRFPASSLSEMLARLDTRVPSPPIPNPSSVPESLEVHDIDPTRAGTPSFLGGGLAGAANTPPTLKDVLRGQQPFPVS